VPSDPAAGPEGARIEVRAEGHQIRFTPYGTFPQGFKVVWSLEPDPVYPPREGDYANYVGPFDERETWLWTEGAPGLYHVRVLEYLGDQGTGVASETLLVEVP